MLERPTTSANQTDNQRQKTKLRQLKNKLEKMQFVMNTEPDGALLLFNSLLFDVLYQLYHNFSTVRIDSALTKKIKIWKE